MALVCTFSRVGDPSVLELVEQTLPAPGPGEALIKISAVGLNFGDSAFRKGTYLLEPQFPARLGVEACGIVLRCGPGVSTCKEGDRVIVLPNFPIGQYGTCATEAILPARSLFPAPAQLSDVQCATIFVAFLTAYGALVDYAAIGKLDKVLITAATSTVGLAAIQVCAERGAHPIGLTRSQDKVSLMEHFGAAAAVVPDDRTKWRETIADLAGINAVKVIFDSVAGECVSELVPILKDEGKYIIYGGMSEQDSTFPRKVMIRRNITLREFQFMSSLDDRKYIDSVTEYIAHNVLSGKFDMPIDITFSLSDASSAYQYFERRSNIGKVVIEP